MIVARPHEGPIRWQCAAFGDAGVISGWEDSPFDLRRRGLAVAPAAAEIVISSQVAAALRELRLLDRDCERIVFAIRADDEQMILRASAEDLEEMIGGVAAEANHETNPADESAPIPPSTPSPKPPTPWAGDRRPAEPGPAPSRVDTDPTARRPR